MTSTTLDKRFKIDDRLNGKLFIGGEWGASSTGRVIDVIDPSTESVIGTAADADLADARVAVDAASQALSSWRATSPRTRAEVLRRCFTLMTERQEWLATLIALENGKTLADAKSEVAYAAEFFRWYAEEAVRIIGEVSIAPSGANRIFVEHEPVGVALLVTPWNFPAAMATRKIAPALAAGCTVVLKPATLTPITAYALAALMEEAGVPDGVVNILTTERTAALVSEVMSDERVRKVSFTGSTEVGRVLLRQAADRVLNCSMELGGNAPFIVCAKADVEAALDGLMIAKMRNNGQACTAANRIYVHRSVAEEFVSKLASRFEALKVGDAVAESTACGPVIDQTSLERLRDLVTSEQDQGADVLAGGKTIDRRGYFLEPTVLYNLASDAEAMRTEIFGPVAPVVAFDDDDEVIAYANDTDMGLAGYVYSEDIKQALRLSRQLQVGMVAINRGLVSDPAAPFGGVKQSGLGREGAHAGVLEYTETKYVAADL
jgi:succinate-semialdehyde dehydrogenase/glutarate-semialdehyde dehydrogenase